jgi:mono/diheme cytochrome c family protein
MEAVMNKLPLTIALLLFSAPVMAADSKKGEALFSSRACVGCHALGKEGSATAGPNLAGVFQRRSEAWLAHWIAAPDKMKDDPIYKELKGQYASDMPNMGLTDDETRSLVLFLKERTN